MEEAIAKADTLIEALGWIRQFRDKVTVIKLGGSVMEDDVALRHVLIDIVFMETVGMRPVVVHGGGAAISRAMDEAGTRSPLHPGPPLHRRGHAGDRRTGAGHGNQRASWRERIEQYGGRAMNLNFARPTCCSANGSRCRDETANRSTWATSGTSRASTGRSSRTCAMPDQVPVIPSMCLDDTGQKLNVNADTAATAVAQALGAEKLVYLSDVNGVRRDKIRSRLADPLAERYGSPAADRSRARSSPA